MNHTATRRSFLLGGTGVAAAGLLPAQESKPALTAAQVIDPIKANIGVPWRGQTVDRIIAGEPETVVRGSRPR